MSRRNKYKYTVLGARQGVWNDYNHSKSVPLEYWHILVQVEGTYETPVELYEDIKNDLEPIFGDVSPRGHILANKQAFDKKGNSLCFQNKIGIQDGKWVLDLHLKEFWNGNIGKII